LLLKRELKRVVRAKVQVPHHFHAFLYEIIAIDHFLDLGIVDTKTWGILQLLEED